MPRWCSKHETLGRPDADHTCWKDRLGQLQTQRGGARFPHAGACGRRSRRTPPTQCMTPLFMCGHCPFVSTFRAHAHTHAEDRLFPLERATPASTPALRRVHLHLHLDPLEFRQRVKRDAILSHLLFSVHLRFFCFLSSLCPGDFGFNTPPLQGKGLPNVGDTHHD